MKVGDKFGRWTVIGEPFRKRTNRYVIVRCSCNTEKAVRVTHLRKGASKSCGCLRREQLTTHGRYDTKLYNIWDAMLRRCTNPSNQSYKNYGGRGITICDEWQDPKIFCEWAEASGYREGLTLDRINNGKGYSPENCHFTSRTVQAENRRKQSNNTSGFIGVSHSGDLWRARAQRDKKSIELGHFDTPEEAARVRDAFVKKHYTSPTLNFQVG